MTPLYSLWQRHSLLLLLLAALAAGLTWGVNLGRYLALTTTPAPVILPTATSPLAPTPMPTPSRLIVHLDIQDLITGEPVKGEVWITINDEADQRVALGVSETEFDLPPGKVIIVVMAKGYLLWYVQVQEWQRRGDADQTLPITAKLKRLPEMHPDRGSG